MGADAFIAQARRNRPVADVNGVVNVQCVGCGAAGGVLIVIRRFRRRTDICRVVPG